MSYTRAGGDLTGTYPNPRLRPGVGSNVVTGAQEDDTAVSISSTTSGAGSSYSWTRGVAIGDAAEVDDVDGVAVGTRADAWAVDGVAVGRDAVTNDYDGDSGVSVGAAANAADNASVAVGPGATTSVDGINSYLDGANVAVGPGATVVGDYSVSVGSVSDPATKGAHGRNAVAIGTDPHAGGFDAIAVGRAAADADGAIAVGTCTASGVDAVAIGTGASATADNDFILGSASHNVNVPGQFSVGAATPVSTQPTPATLADVIAILQAFGFAA